VDRRASALARRLTMSFSVAPAAVRGMDEVASIYDDHHAEVYGYAASLTRDPTAAEDVLHEAFARLVREYRTGRPPDDPRAWLYRVCTNLVISGSRRRAVADRWHHIVAGGSSDTDEPAEDVVVRHEHYRDLTRVLDRMPADQRAALLLAAEGFSGREVAGILGKSEGGTRNLLWRARQRMQERLEREADR
jgi:RNA polymerase sigma-70 factor (ECF subfamily)